MDKRKIVIGASIASGLFGLFYAVRADQLRNKIIVTPLVNLARSGISLTAQKIAIDVVIQNPTAMSVNLSDPFVKLISGSGQNFGNSQPTGRVYTIPSNNSVTIPIDLFVPTQSLVGLAGSVSRNDVYAETFIRTGPFRLLPVTITEQIDLRGIVNFASNALRLARQ